VRQVERKQLLPESPIQGKNQEHKKSKRKPERYFRKAAPRRWQSVLSNICHNHSWKAGFVLISSSCCKFGYEFAARQIRSLASLLQYENSSPIAFEGWCVLLLSRR
jgi:hypothetical protein